MTTNREAHLVETDWLAEHLGDPKLRIVDMRGYVKLQNHEGGIQTADYINALDEYEAGHIPGAIYLDWTKDIVDLSQSVPAQVADPDQVAKVFGGAGLGDDTLIVAYDAHPTSQFATRLWWVMRYYGHDNVRVLNGGFKKWQAEDRPLETEQGSYSPATFTPNLQPSWRATAEDVLAQIKKPGVAIVDARDEGQYTGAIRRGSRGGHIPGALHLARESLIDLENGVFRTDDELRSIVEAQGLKKDEQIVAYCNGGVAATSLLFALSILGYDKLTNYDGSWNEWTERTELPVEK